jgi:hypothetical protein
VTSSESCASPCTLSQPTRRSRTRRVAVNPSPAQPTSGPKAPHRTPVRGAAALHARAARYSQVLIPSSPSWSGLVVADDRRAPPPCSPGEGKARASSSQPPFRSQISASPGLTSVLPSSRADASRRRPTGSGRSPGPSATRRPRARMLGPPGRPARRYSVTPEHSASRCRVGFRPPGEWRRLGCPPVIAPCGVTVPARALLLTLSQLTCRITPTRLLP